MININFLKDYNLCKVIEPKECLGIAWTKKNKEELCPNLLKMIQNFNAVSKWIAATIVKETVLKKRVTILSHIMEMLQVNIENKNKKK